MASNAQHLLAVAAGRGYEGLSRRQLLECIACQSGEHNFSAQTVIVSDGSGGFWEIVIDPSGTVGAVFTAGPASAAVILDDGSGGFWLLVVDADGQRGLEASAGPATTVPVISDGDFGLWTLVADASGNLGAQSL